MIQRNVCFFFRLLNFFVKLENYTGTIQSEKRRYSVSFQRFNRIFSFYLCRHFGQNSHKGREQSQRKRNR